MQIRQTIERYTRKISNNLSHKERIEAFANVIAENPAKFAEDLLFLEQRSKDLDAQLIGINLLVGKDYDPDFSNRHDLISLIRRCISPFMPLMKSNDVQIDFNDLEDIEIQTDFRIFNCAMFHFFDNIQKYVKPSTRVGITVNKNSNELIFTMTSRAIDDNEKEIIFHEGFNGVHAKNQKGEGLGLYIFSLVLDKLDAKVCVNWDPVTRLGSGDFMYQENVFILKFPNETLYY